MPSCDGTLNTVLKAAHCPSRRGLSRGPPGRPRRDNKAAKSNSRSLPRGIRGMKRLLGPCGPRKAFFSMSDFSTSEPRHKVRLKMSEGARRLGCSQRHLYVLAYKGEMTGQRGCQVERRGAGHLLRGRRRPVMSPVQRHAQSYGSAYRVQASAGSLSRRLRLRCKRLIALTACDEVSVEIESASSAPTSCMTHPKSLQWPRRASTRREI